jgi:putative oxidoreductase
MLIRLNQKLKNITEKYQDFLILILRLSVALIFIRTGYGKLMHLDKTVMFFESLGIPFANLNALLAAGTELIGGLCILAGLFTRIVSFPLAFVMVIAIATAQWREVTGLADLVSLIEYLYLIIFLLFTSLGAGKLSLDALWLEKKSKTSKKNSVKKK